MSFGGFGGFGGNTTNTGYGGGTGFGTTNNALVNSNPFGPPGAATNGFGASTNTNTGFAGSGFGSTAPGLFGAAPASNTMFGAPLNNNATSTGFGAASGGMFGAAKPPATGFGAAAAPATNNMFGGAATIGFGAKPQPAGNGGDRADTYFEERMKYDQKQAENQQKLSSFGASNTGQMGGGFGAPGIGFGAASQPQNSAFGGGFDTNNSSGGQNPFGAVTNSNTAPGGMFGAPKPAATGFGTTLAGFGAPQPTTQPQTGFGTGFGGNPTGFGTANNTAAGPSAPFGQQPASTLFGGTNTANATGFGNTTNPPAGGLFNSSTLGQGTQQAAPAAGPFGGAFGQSNAPANNQLKPAGTLFGATATTSAAPAQTLFGSAGTTVTAVPSLFGVAATATNTTNPSGNFFGAAANTNAPATSMFSNANAAAPAKPFGATGNLFGSALPSSTQAQNTAATGGSTLFNSAGAAQPGGSLFGNLAPKPSNMFGGSAATTGAGGFNTSQAAAGTNAQNPGFSLLGNQALPPGGNSLFGASTQSNGAPFLTASLMDNPYGHMHLFSSLNTAADNTSVGPLAKAVPQAGSARKLVPLIHNRLNPRASRLLTPQRPQSNGFTLSHSPFTPSTSIGTPLGRSTGPNATWAAGSANKSYPINLSGHSSVFFPGVLAGSSETQSLRRLTVHVDRQRNPFAAKDSPAMSTPLAKRVEWANGLEASATASPALSSEANDPPPVSPEGFDYDSPQPIISPRSTKAKAQPPAVQDGHVVHVPRVRQVDVESDPDSEEASLHQENAARVSRRTAQIPGDVYMIPSLEELERIPKDKRYNIKNFVVGRHYCGSVTFDNVDLRTTDLRLINTNIVDFSAACLVTVYGPACGVPKPAVGAPGLNNSATVRLENCWSHKFRGRHNFSQRKIDDIDERFKKTLQTIDGATFVDYSRKSGIWTFQVEHFSTWGTREALARRNGESLNNDDSDGDFSDDDVGGFEPSIPANLGQPRNQLFTVPGAFSELLDFPPSHGVDSNAPGIAIQSPGESAPFVASHRIRSPEPISHDATAIQTPSHHPKRLVPKSIMKAGRMDGLILETPTKHVQIAHWAHELVKSASPRKQNRSALRQNQPPRQHGAASVGRPLFAPPQFAPTRDSGPPIVTSIDLMNSLWGAGEAIADKGTPFEWPYAKKQKTNHGISTTDAKSGPRPGIKPIWSVDGSLTRVTRSITAPVGFEMVGSVLHTNELNIMTLKLAETLTAHVDALAVQETQSSFLVIDDVPAAIVDGSAEFSRYQDIGSLQSASHERAAWSLASVLFDPVSLDANLVSDATGQARSKVQLLQIFWRKLVADDVERALRHANSLEERAFIYLTGGNVPQAVQTLHGGGNSVLALLVSNIGGDATFREHCVQQLEDWMSRDFISEFPDAIRAIYALLCGHTCRIAGKSTGGHENRVQPLNLSSKFGLDWRRAFGLRLWYGLLTDEPVERAVKLFADDLQSGDEEAWPASAFSPETARHDGREDLLWGMLQLFASRFGQPSPNASSFLAPENACNSMDDYRLSFQICQLLRARLLPGPVVPNLDEVSDKLAYVYHEQLLLLSDGPVSRDPSSSLVPSDSSPWCLALIPLLYVRDRASRVASIRALLSRFAGLLPDDEDPLFVRLTQDLKIPTRWIFAAKAEFAAAALDDAPRQADWLLRAHLWTEAHRVLRTSVGPKAIIEGNFVHLRELLSRFIAADAPSSIVDWKDGGQILFDFVTLIDSVVRTSDVLPSHQRHEVNSVEMGELIRTRSQCLVRLATSLSEISKRENLQSWNVLQRAAVFEMSRLVGRAVDMDRRLSQWGTSVVLRFPLEADMSLKYAVELGGRYFKSVLGGGGTAAA